MLVGDISKDELFATHREFYQNYLDAEPLSSDEKLDLDGISLKVLFGTWCHDSQREIPKLLRLLEDINIKPELISLIGLNYQKNEPQNRGVILKIKKTPTIIIYRYKEEIGRIEESPKLNFEQAGISPVTLEENIFFILSS
jgi:thiol-disulfide isomerase/thioredoxin